MTKSANVTTVKFTDGREICLSYGVPVAAFLPDAWAFGHDAPRGYIKTDRKYSTTTSRHANAYAGESVTVVRDAVFVTLIAPLETKR